MSPREKEPSVRSAHQPIPAILDLVMAVRTVCLQTKDKTSWEPMFSLLERGNEVGDRENERTMLVTHHAGQRSVKVPRGRREKCTRAHV